MADAGNSGPRLIVTNVANLSYQQRLKKALGTDYSEDKKPSKFKNVRTVIDGHNFMSKREADRYVELKILVRAGEIKNLELQPKYDIILAGHKVARYIADFRYIDIKTNKTIVEDVKGVRTREYIRKRKLMKDVLDIAILET